MTWLTAFLSEATHRWADRSRFGWGAFAARNVRLETRLADSRKTEYLDFIGEPRDQPAWLALHRAFELERIAMPSAPPRRILAKSDRDAWPSPFRWMDEPLGLASEEYLVHVASAYALSAPSVGVTPRGVLDAIAGHDDDLLDDVLDNWWRSGPRTIFAALSEDVGDVVRAAMIGDPGWATAMRDRLGLVHYDPLRDPIDVVLLRYRVHDVPRAEGLRTRRPVLAPSAIDSGLNAAFCPFPHPDQEGRAVDLLGQLDPIREVIHPRPLLTAKHVVASGEILRPVPDLLFARWVHIEWLRDTVGPADFALETDGDLAC